MAAGAAGLVEFVDLAQQLVEEGKLKNSIVNSSVMENVVTAVEDYKNRTSKIKDKINFIGKILFINF